MNEMLFTFPQIDPVAIALGPLQIRWYALAYVAGLIGGWWVLRRQIAAGLSVLDKDQLDGLMNACLVGILVGGRLGYVLFYNPSAYLAAPLDIVKVWQGGMSFHGGLSGVILAILWSARRYQLSPLSIGDEVALVAPLGLLFGRLANFINGELYGRVTDHPFGIVYPGGGPLPRHPSQLYEAGLEGLGLLVLVWAVRRWQRKTGAADGLILSCFLGGYGLARFMVEFVRAPDAHIGLLAAGLSMGQLLCLPMIAAGLGGIIWCRRQRRP
ncbi:MAG: prolipoprotein diacylglyceryl transferase [Candidatus Puniceispirillaceae bacterium]|nr:prolipoprotein diacylglyceryl transferase [Alphaproteobacteria bacterium]